MNLANDRNLDRFLLVALVFVNSLTICGYFLFDGPGAPLRELAMKHDPDGAASSIIAQSQIILAGAILIIYLSKGAGRRWLASLPIIYIGAFLVEWAGETYGVPFGRYTYTSELGVSLFDSVPLVIPLAWFSMLIPAYRLGGHPGRSRCLCRIFAASMLVVAWDLVLDPAMSVIKEYWVWDPPGIYYGVPAINFVGWFLTALVLLRLIDAAGARNWAGELDRRWMLFYFCANVAVPLAMALGSGFILAGIFFAIVFLAALYIGSASVLTTPSEGQKVAEKSQNSPEEQG